MKKRQRRLQQTNVKEKVKERKEKGQKDSKSLIDTGS